MRSANGLLERRSASPRLDRLATAGWRLETSRTLVRWSGICLTLKRLAPKVLAPWVLAGALERRDGQRRTTPPERSRQARAPPNADGQLRHCKPDNTLTSMGSGSPQSRTSSCCVVAWIDSHRRTALQLIRLAGRATESWSRRTGEWLPPATTSRTRAMRATGSLT